MGIENKEIVLKLNKHWVVVDTAIVGDALIDLCAGLNSYAVDIDYELNEDGSPDRSRPKPLRPVAWEEWITLPVRDWDFSIRSPNMVIRVPTVLIAKNYEDIPKVRFGKNPSSEQIRMRDNNRCQYTGRKLKRGEGSLDHVVPESRGGKNTWENLVYACKEVNTKKGNKLNKEAGLKLLREPRKPEPIYRYKLITDARHPDWRLFLKHIDED